jgi:hypothetical protein
MQIFIVFECPFGLLQDGSHFEQVGDPHQSQPSQPWHPLQNIAGPSSGAASGSTSGTGCSHKVAPADAGSESVM